MPAKSIGDRMKEYEEVTTAATLTRRVPVIIRLDGRAFHTFSRKLESPYDETFHECMCKTTMDVCKMAQGSRIAYHFSDEVSILVTDYQTVDTDPYFGYSLQKVLSVTASAFTAKFADACLARGVKWCPPIPQFDCRAFSIPTADVGNYFLWRQQDCTRNSIQSLARSMFSHKQLMNKNSSQMQDMMMEKGVNWDKQPTKIKRGISIFKLSGEDERGWVADYEVPIFSRNRSYVEGWVMAIPEFSPETHEKCSLKTAVDIGFPQGPRGDNKHQKEKAVEL